MRRLLLAGITLLLAANAASAQRGPMRDDDRAPYDRRVPDEDLDGSEDDGDDSEEPGAFRGPPPDDARPLPRGRRGPPPVGDDDDEED